MNEEPAMWREITEKSLKVLDELNPGLSAKILTKRYVLPKRLQGTYAALYKAQEEDIRIMAMYMIEKRSSDSNIEKKVLNIYGSALCGRPTLYLEPELGEALMRTDLPKDLSTDDIRWPRTAVRIMLPKGLCMSYVDKGNFPGQEMDSIAYMDLSLMSRYFSTKTGSRDVDDPNFVPKCIVTGSTLPDNRDYITDFGFSYDWYEGRTLEDIVEKTVPADDVASMEDEKKREAVNAFQRLALGCRQVLCTPRPAAAPPPPARKPIDLEGRLVKDAVSGKRFGTDSSLWPSWSTPFESIGG